MTVVADSGPLMALAKIGGLDALRALHPRVFTPPSVRAEVVEAGLRLGLEDAKLLESQYARGFLEVRQSTLSVLPVAAAIGPGETESILLAIDSHADWLLVDDWYARRAAVANFTATASPPKIQGTLGVIVSCYRAGHVSSDEAIGLVEVIRGRPDIWISREICDRVVVLLREES